MVIDSNVDSGSAERDSENLTVDSVKEEPLDPQQSLALPSQFGQNSTMRRIEERECRFLGKFVDFR